jgi:hypothetical protein
MFGLGRSSGGLDQKTEKKILEDSTPPLKRFEYLKKFTENSQEAEVRPFYQANYSKVYTIFLDALLALDNQAKTTRSMCVILLRIISSY